MILFVLAYLGGVLTIISPCILPVLPFVFARSDKPFVSSGPPMLAGMAVTFAVVATLAAVGGGWAVQANEYGRFAALTLLALFGITLLFPALSDRLTRPLVALGSRLSEAAGLGAANGKPIRFRATIDSKPPGDSHGADVDAGGQGVVGGQRLYQLIRQSGAITDRTFEIRFLGPGAEVYAFTFG